MSKTTIVKFVKENGDVFYIGTGYLWKFQNSGFSSFAELDANLSITENYSRDGGATQNVRLNSKDRTLKVAFMDWRNNETARIQWLKFFNYNQTYDVYVTFEGKTRWARGMLRKMQLSEPTESDYLFKATMTLHFDDPYWMSVEDFGKNIAGVIPNFGFPWMCPIDKEVPVGIFNFDRMVTVFNDGEHIAYPRIKVTFVDNVTNPIVYINDGFIKILGDFTKTDVIEIDYTQSPPVITCNGENILGHCDRSSKFDEMYILIGENVIAYDADFGNDEMAVVLRFNKLYTVL